VNPKYLSDDALDLSIDWTRCVFIEGEFDQALVTRLMPEILRLRQESNRPITVSIDSHGGSLSVMRALMALLTGPDQNGDTCKVVSVATHRAYSAAANFLALSDYAVGLSHSKILFHDVRYGGMDDVTPSSALVAAKNLTASNESAALGLANKMFARWMWNYLDLVSKFDDDKARFPRKTEKYEGLVTLCKLPNSKSVLFDLVGFAISTFAKLSRESEVLLNKAMDRLGQWGAMISLAAETPQYRSGETPGLLDGALPLFQAFDQKQTEPFGSTDNANDLRLFLTCAVSRMATAPHNDTIDSFEGALGDYSLLKSLDDPKHQVTATRMMLRHKHVFLDFQTAENWNSFDQSAKDAVLKDATPVVRTAWLLCTLVARELFNGEHTLTATDAMCLGLIDEVPGVEVIVSRRQFIADRDRKAAEVAEAAQPSGRASSPGWRRVKVRARMR
jgi:ATP-dependent protease ClpP protease subunit